MTQPMIVLSVPGTLNCEAAGKAGEILSDICRVAPKFLRLFENPTYDSDSVISEYTLHRALANALPNLNANEALKVLEDAGLVRELAGGGLPGIRHYAPTCRINLAKAPQGRGEVSVCICTDSPMVDFDTRVFPWADEGEELFSAVCGAWSGVPERILDVFSGAGTVGLLLGKLWPSARITAIDIDERAIGFSRFNAQLNGQMNYEPIQFDIMQTNFAEKYGSGGYDIVCVDPPFAAMPDQIAGYAHSALNRDIHERALDLSIPQVRKGGLLMFLTYSFGGPDRPDELLNLLSRADLSGFDEPTIVRVRKPLWRLHGEKQNPLNPMPVQYMDARYFDPDWLPKFKQAGMSYGDYVYWIEDLAKKKRTHIHYVILSAKRIR